MWLQFFPDKPIFYLNILATLAVFCLVCWLSLRLLTRAPSRPVTLTTTLQVLARTLAAVLAGQIVTLAVPQAVLLLYVVIRGRDALAAFDPILQASGIWGAVILVLSLVLPALSAAAQFARQPGGGWWRAGASILLATAVTWALAAAVDPYYQALVAFSERQ